MSARKIGVVIYHRNILSKYNPEWIYDCILGIENQTFQDFSVIELNFGGDHERLYKGSKESYFYSERIDNLGMAITRAFDICFKEHKLDLVFNINLDDSYTKDRFEKQLKCLDETGADVVTSNFHFVDSDLNITSSTKFCAGLNDMSLQNRIIDYEFSRNHNIIGFPVCLFTRNFWEENAGLPSDDVSKGREDFDLWINARKKGFNFYIMEEPLFKYRVHSSNISKRINNL